MIDREEDCESTYEMISNAVEKLESQNEKSMEFDEDAAYDALVRWDEIRYNDKPVGFLMYFFCCNEFLLHASWALIIPLSKGYYLVDDYQDAEDNEWHYLEDVVCKNTEQRVRDVVSIHDKDGKFVGIITAMKDYLCLGGSHESRTRICVVRNTFILEKIERYKKLIEEGDFKSLNVFSRF